MTIVYNLLYCISFTNIICIYNYRLEGLTNIFFSISSYGLNLIPQLNKTPDSFVTLRARIHALLTPQKPFSVSWETNDSEVVPQFERPVGNIPLKSCNTQPLLKL